MCECVCGRGDLLPELPIKGPACLIAHLALIDPHKPLARPWLPNYPDCPKEQ